MQYFKPMLKVGVASVSLLAVTAPALAQQEGSEGNRAGSAEAGQRQLSSEIVVTAQKRSQVITDVAASISAFSSSMIEDRGITDLDALQQQVPSVALGNSLGAAQVSIRGVGWTINTGAGEPGVAVHLDGIYESRPALADIAQFDMERIEILRGPQGTLYGRNATGGTINFISAAPTSEFEGYARFGFAEYKEVRTEAVLSGPISDNIRARAGITRTYRGDPFIPNVVPGEKGIGVRRNFGAKGRIDIDFSDRFTGEFGVLYVDENSIDGGFIARGPVSDAQLYVNPVFSTVERRFGPDEMAANDPMIDREAYQLRGTLSFDLNENLTLKSMTGYTDIDNYVEVDGDQIGVNSSLIFNDYTSKAFSQEFNLSGDYGALQFVAGAFYFDEKYEGSQNVDFYTDVNLGLPAALLGLDPDVVGPFVPLLIFPAGTELIQAYTEKRKSYAGFADVTYSFTDQLSLNVGARYSRDEVKLNQTQGLSTGLTCEGLMTEADFNAFTPAATLKFEPTPDSNIYGKVSKGYKSGGINFGTCGDEYDPEKVTAYEIGAKAIVMDGMLSFSTAAFYYDYEDLQVYQLVPLSLGGGTFIDNAPKARIKGAEFDLTLRPALGLTLNFGGAYVDATFREYFNVDSEDLAGVLQDLSGNRISRSPKFTGNAGIQYEAPEISGLGTFTLRGEMYHSGSQYFTEFNLPKDKSESYEVYNAFVKLSTIDDQFEIKAYGKNLTDKRYINFSTRATLIGTTAVNYSDPRQFGVEATVRF